MVTATATHMSAKCDDSASIIVIRLKHVGCSGELAGCSFSADGFDEELKCFGLLHHGILWPFSQVEAEGDKREEGTESLPVSSISLTLPGAAQGPVQRLVL